MPRASRLLVALVIGAVGLAAWPQIPAASAAPDPIDVEIEHARAEVELAESAAQAANSQLEAAQQRTAAVEAQITAVQAQIADLNARIPALQGQVRTLRADVRTRAAQLYRSADAGDDAGALSFESPLLAARRAHLGAAAARHDADTMNQLNAAVEELQRTKDQLAVQQRDLASQQAQLAAIQAGLEARQHEFDALVAKADAALARARAIGALRAQGEPVLGPSVLTAAQMAGWIRSQGYHVRLETSIDDLAAIYIQEGAVEGVRGDLAFAQSVVETGGFTAAPANNYAGMGWCDSCRSGTQFPTPRDGVRAQIQHLKNYADSTSRASGLHYPPSPYWYGSNPSTAIHNFNTFFAKGWAPNWRDMGHGNWATDKNYPSKVLHVYSEMVAFAQGH